MGAWPNAHGRPTMMTLMAAALLATTLNTGGPTCTSNQPQWSWWCNETSCQLHLEQQCLQCGVYGPCNGCEPGTITLDRNWDGSGQCACNCNGRRVSWWCWDMVRGGGK